MEPSNVPDPNAAAAAEQHRGADGRFTSPPDLSSQLAATCNELLRRTVALEHLLDLAGVDRLAVSRVVAAAQQIADATAVRQALKNAALYGGSGTVGEVLRSVASTPGPAGGKRERSWSELSPDEQSRAARESRSIDLIDAERAQRAARSGGPWSGLSPEEQSRAVREGRSIDLIEQENELRARERQQAAVGGRG